MILCMPPMSDPSEFNTELSRPPDPPIQRQTSLSRPRGLPNPVSEVSIMVQALAAAGQSEPSRDCSVQASRMISTTQGPYSEYMDISRASATPWRPIQDWSSEAHSPSSFTHRNSNSPELPDQSADLSHCSPQQGTNSSLERRTDPPRSPVAFRCFWGVFQLEWVSSVS